MKLTKAKNLDSLTKDLIQAENALEDMQIVELFESIQSLIAVKVSMSKRILSDYTQSKVDDLDEAMCTMNELLFTLCDDNCPKRIEKRVEDIRTQQTLKALA